MLVLPAEITHPQAGACLQMLTQAARREGEPVVAVDATALQRFDSSALAVLLEVRRACLRDGRELRVQAMPERLRSLADLYGVLALLAPAEAAPATEEPLPATV